jgi:uncharacterized protein YndB with AHSA1/START domain
MDRELFIGAERSQVRSETGTRAEGGFEKCPPPCPFAAALFVESLKLSATHQKSKTMSSSHTIRLHRVLRSSPEKIYRAFTEAAAMERWLPPCGFTGKVHHLDAKVGGAFKMSFTNFGAGKGHSFGGEFLELVPHERIRYTDKFDDPNLPGVITVTVTLKKVMCGTELNVEQAGVPAVIPAEMCYLGWQDSLEMLAKLVEPEIPDA